MMMDLPAGTLALGMGSITGAAAAGRRLARISGEKSRLCAGYVMLAGKLNHNAARNSIRFGETFSHPPIAGDHPVAIVAGYGLTPKFAARALHNQSARRDVPQADAALDVGVEPAHRHVGQGKRGGTHDADFADAAREFAEVGQGLAQVVFALREADGDDGFAGLRPPADADDTTIATRGPTFDRSPEFVLKRIVDDAENGFVVRPRASLKSNRNRRVWNFVGEVHGAVDRVHDPALVGVRRAGHAFFAEHGDLRKRVVQCPLDQFLAALVQFEFDVVRSG